MIRFKFAMSPLLKTCLASFIALCATLPAQAQQSPLIADDAPRPVTTAYLLVPGEEDSMQLYFGEAALQSDDKVGFEAMWEMLAWEEEVHMVVMAATCDGSGLQIHT